MKNEINELSEISHLVQEDYRQQDAGQLNIESVVSRAWRKFQLTSSCIRKPGQTSNW